MAEVLFTDRTTDGTSDAYEIEAIRGAVAVTGTFDGAEVDIEMSIDGGTTYVSTETITAASIKIFQFIKRGLVRAVVSSAGASTSLTVKVRLEN